MFLLDIIFMLFALHLWTPLNMCPTRHHTLYRYLTDWVKIPSSSVTYISCNTPYFCDTLRDIRSFKTNLLIIFKSLTSSISNLFKDTENPFHFLVLSFTFLYLLNVRTLNILKVLRLMLSVVALLKLLWFFFLYLGFLSRTFTIHRTAGEGGGYFFKSALPLPPASKTLRH